MHRVGFTYLFAIFVKQKEIKQQKPEQTDNSHSKLDDY